MKKPYRKSEALKILEKMDFENLVSQYPNTPTKYLPKPTYSDNDANSLTKAIIRFIWLKNGQAERVNSIGKQIDRRETVTDICGRTRQVGSLQWIRSTGTTGTADISATIAGRSVKIEVKCSATGDRYQSEAQKAYERSILKAGGLYFIATDFEQFYNWYNQNFGR
ncbi:MAG: hypothetical protein FD155_556 [Bacteroidetes bacterium]|nr:MAG: hypothetical protein FD155_556 [Bacteroidota bacterium]